MKQFHVCKIGRCLTAFLFVWVLAGAVAAQTGKPAPADARDSSSAVAGEETQSYQGGTDDESSQSIQPSNFLVGASVVIIVIVVIIAALKRRRQKMDIEAWLVIISGDKAGARLPIDKIKLSIGSHQDNDIVLTDDHIARHHCLLTYDRGVFHLTDMNSLYGTFIGKKRITQQELSVDDEVNLGGAVDLKLELGN